MSATLIKRTAVGIGIGLLILIIFTITQTILFAHSIINSSSAYLNTIISHENNPEVIAAFKKNLASLQTLVSNIRTIDQRLASADKVLQVITPLLSGSHTYLIIFQNTQELRATGGFIGTYALVTLTDGKLDRLTVQDMYVPDGQFTGYVEAPAGVKEYLSSGKGLRLPDANWDPDFPTSVHHILPFFSFAGEQNIEGVIAINLPVAQEILKITGPVTIPDYETTVTADNFADVARSGREQFFPGSQQKQHLMSAIFDQLLIALNKTTFDQRKKILEALIQSAQHKDILFYSQNEKTENIFNELHVADTITVQPNTNFYFYSVESNVGINKANKHIDRTVSINLGSTSSTIMIIINNANLPPTPEYVAQLAPTEAKHLGYVNYQRYLVLPDYSVKSITVGVEPVQKWDEEIITTADGSKLKQVGFLVTVPEQQQALIRLELNHPALPTSPKIQIDKQPGISPTFYSIEFNNKQKQFQLGADTILLWTN